MSLETTAPTRMNLLARRAQIKLAADGAQLLQGKREALLKELLARARELRRLREELHTRGRAAQTELALARAVRGTQEVHSAATACRREARAHLQRQRVWGLDLFEAKCDGIRREDAERPIGKLDYSAHITEAMRGAEAMLEQLIRCGVAEANLRTLGQEVRKVSRRINALEEQLLPRLRHDVRRIDRTLEERQREDVFRMKRFKTKKTSQTARSNENG